jgi:N utilization substance protein B
MALPPQKMREAVFQLLYSLEEGACDATAAVHLLSKELSIGKHHINSALERVYKLQNERSSIEEAISKHSPAYAFTRIHSVERNILRLAAFEILHDTVIPPKVAIAEAMRLTRKFSTDSSAGFVNAVLDAIYRDTQGLAIDHDLISASTAEMLANDDAASDAAALATSDISIEEIEKYAS